MSNSLKEIFNQMSMEDIIKELSLNGCYVIYVGDNLLSLSLAEELNDIIQEQGIQTVVEKLKQS